MAKDTDLLDPVEALEMRTAFAKPATGQEIAIHQPTSVDITEGVITARKVEVRRDEGAILQRIATQAAAAGEHWYYAFPVKKKGGGTDSIEGPSIKCANAVARLYGNCQVDCRVLDAGKNWLIYARFVDYETGYSLTRPFQQSKTGSKLGGTDDERREQAAMSIGVSKAERNVICNALETFTDYAFEAAKANLVARVGKRLDEYKQRCIDRLGELGVETKRAERSIGKTVEAWVARDVAKLIAEIKSVQDGMATAEETWPTEAPPEPRRSDAENDAVATGAAAGPDRPAAEAGPAAAASNASPPVSDDPPSPSPKTSTTVAPEGDAVGGPAAGNSAPTSSPPGAGQSPELSMPLEHWRVDDDVLGQENIIKRLEKLVGLAETLADIDAIEKQNAERLAKITGNRRATLNNTIRAKRESLGRRHEP
jgi:hypothetical protein